MVAGLRFCHRHDVWPVMMNGPNVIHGGSWRIVGAAADPDAQAVICLLGILYPDRFEMEAHVVAALGQVLAALRYRP